MGGWLGPSVMGGQSVGACGWVSWPIPLANYFRRWQIVFLRLFCSVPLLIVQIRTKQLYYNAKTHTRTGGDVHGRTNLHGVKIIDDEGEGLLHLSYAVDSGGSFACLSLLR